VRSWRQAAQRRQRKLPAVPRAGDRIIAYDPTTGEWHDFPARDCFPSIVAEACAHRKGGAA
jgi:hypothetical protein